MFFHSTSSDLLWLEKLGNLREEKALSKQSKGLGSRDDHPLHPKCTPLFPSLQVWLHPIFYSSSCPHPS